MHLDMVLSLRLVLDTEAAVEDGLSYTFTFLLAVDKPQAVHMAEADRAQLSMAATILDEEERVCPSFDVYSTDESEVYLAQIPHNHVDDPVVVNVGLVRKPGVADHLDVVNGVAKNLFVLLPLDPGRPGVLDGILHHVLHALAVVQQHNCVFPSRSNTYHLGWWTFTCDFPEEEGTNCAFPNDF